jgi:hypothetical protein
MIFAAAFACVSSDGVSVSGIEFTPELKACLGLSDLGSMITNPLDELEIEPNGHATKQQLQRVHETSTHIRLPTLSFKRNRSLGGIMDISINFDCLGICFHELDGPGEAALPPKHISSNDRPPAGINDVSTKKWSATSHLSLVKKPQDLLRHSRKFGGDRFLKVASRYRIKAVMLVEPPEQGRESRLCLYTNPDTCDETERAFQNLSIALRV